MTPLLPLLAAAVLNAAPLTLDQALAEAESQSLELEAARARLQQAEQLSARAWAGYLPTLTVGGSYTRNNVEARIRQPTGYNIRDVGAPPSGTPGPYDPSQPASPQNPPGQPTSHILYPADYADIVIQPLDALGAQAQVSQAILAPALFPAIRSAGLATEAAQQSTEATRREVLFAVAQGYFGVATLQEALKVNEHLLDVAKAHERDAKVKESAGATSRLARLRAELERSRAEQDVVRAKNALESGRLALAALLNRPADFDVVPPGEVQLPEGLESSPEALGDALQKRPDVAAARTGAEVAHTNRVTTALKYAPTVGLTARGNVSNAAGFSGSNQTWAVTLGVNWTLWDGGLREAELREASAKIAEARATQAQAERRASDELAKSRLDLVNSRASLSKAEDSAKLARESARLAEKSYQAGAASSLEVTDANTALAQAEVGLLTERLNVQLTSLRLLKAAGLFAAQ